MVFLPQFQRFIVWICACLIGLSGSAIAAYSGDTQHIDSIEVSGEWRVRLEGLTGQFRTGTDARDQAALSRLLVNVAGRRDDLVWQVELIDSRAYLDDAGTPIDTGLVNPLDILAANVGVRLDKRGSEIRLGRFTQNIGSRRLIARNGFRNTINAFSGLNGHFLHPDGSETRAFFAFPVGRQPTGRAALGDNDLAFDGENFNQRIWALWHRRDWNWAGASLELYTLGLFEDDASTQQTRNRKLFTPGFRLFRPPARGRWDFDFETSLQFGQARATTAPDDLTDRDVSAHFHHGEVGYTFKSDWNWRISAEYDFASGDGDPANGTLGRFDPLFGARRRELGNTSLFGPLSRANLNQPSVRLSFAKGRWDGRVHVVQAFLEQAEDSLAVAGLVDPTGASGDNVGLLVSGRTRYWAVPDVLRLEAGFGILAKGRFTRTAPGANPAGDTFYGYVQATTRF